MPREKIEFDPLALVGICLTVVGMAVGGTWFIISRSENSETTLLKQQVQFLDRQVQIHRQESQEQSDVLRRISNTANNPAVKKLVDAVLKESIGILGPRELGINEAVVIPNTHMRIVYEDVINYPYLRRLRSLLWGGNWLVFPSSLQVLEGNEVMVNNSFPKAGSEAKFDHQGIKYRLVILAVRETGIRISLFGEKEYAKSN